MTKKSEGTEVAQATDTPQTGVQKTTSSNGLQTFDLNGQDLPDLDEAQEMPVNLMEDYWTPEKEGEAKRLFFSHFADRVLVDKDSGEVSDKLLCAYFFEKRGKEVVTVSNASKRLVGAIQNNKIQRGTPLLITYMGKKKNSTNEFKSDSWSIKPLIVKI